MKVKVIIFDLDDTLYGELDYVRSGLSCIALDLEQVLDVSSNQLYQDLLLSLAENRSEIFDRVLKKYDVWNEELIQQCVSRYREHIPNIKLSTDVLQLIEKLAKEFSLYVVTDGHAGVQNMKLKTLGLSDNPAIKHCYATYALGDDYGKPSPKCFQMICENEQCNPEDIVYIGDNPDKDFLGIRPLGFRTIRLMQGQHSHKIVPPESDAEIKALDLFSACENLSVQLPD